MHFQKADLAGTHYRWLKDSEKNMFTGEPSRRSFDRENGDQVLFLINFYASSFSKFSIQEGRSIEYDLLNHLPLTTRSEITVYNWITERFAEGVFHKKRLP